MNKYIINYNQSGGNRIVTKLRYSVCEQVTNIINHLLNALFIPNNSSMWHGTDFYHLFGNQSAVLNLKVVQLEYMISSITHRHMDPSYSAKIGLVKFAMDGINTLKDSLRRLGSDLRINSISDITKLKINCDSNHVPVNFNSPIQVQENMIDNSHGPFSTGPYSVSSPIIPPSSPPNTFSLSSSPGSNMSNISKKYRCIYRDPTCVGDRDVITLDDINPNNIGNVVKVDKKCYNADELQKWLVNNPTLPHNRQPYTSKELNACVGDKFSVSPPSISSPTTSTIISPSLLTTTVLSPSPSLISTISSPNMISTPFINQKPKKYIIDELDEEWDLDEDWDLDDGTDSKFISSYNNSKKKSSKKKSSKKKGSKKKGSKKKNSKKKGSKKKGSKKKGSKKKGSKKKSSKKK